MKEKIKKHTKLDTGFNQEYRRLIFIRKDLNLSTGKLIAQLGHCLEIPWLNFIKKLPISKENSITKDEKYYVIDESSETLYFPKDIMDNYINGKIVKTILQVKNLNQLKKAAQLLQEEGLKEGEDFGFVNDACRTELNPENENGTCTTALWTMPLSTELAHKISKKFHLYTDSKKEYIWENKDSNKYICSHCGSQQIIMKPIQIFKYCPECGAKMKEND